MRKLLSALTVFVVSLAAPLCAAAESEPIGPMAISKWSIQWDRFKRKTVINATFKNTSEKRVSDLSVTLEFFDDNGKLVKKSSPWRKSYLSGRSKTRMKLKTGCPPFQKYRVKLSGKAKDDFQQLFEAKYWPEKPGDIPDMPKPIVLAQGAADVRVAGSKTEYLKVSKNRESLRISGTVQNMGDRPAENVVVTITMVAGKKAVWTKNIVVKPAKLEPEATAPFSVILKRIPYHTKVTYSVNFDSKGSIGENQTSEKFDIEAGALIIKDCIIDSKTGLFTGTLLNKGEKTVSDVVVNISIEKAGVTTTYKIKPGGDIKPGDNLSLIKATTPGFDNFGVSLEFLEK